MVVVPIGKAVFYRPLKMSSATFKTIVNHPSLLLPLMDGKGIELHLVWILFKINLIGAWKSVGSIQ